MADRKRYIVKDSNIVFISDVDKQIFISEGDFVAPPIGYYSNIESIHKKQNEVLDGIKIKTLSCFKYRNNFLEVPFILLIYEEDNNIIFNEIFNIKKVYNFEIINVKYNILENLLNNYNINERYYTRKIIVDKNTFYNSLSNKNYIEVTIDYRYYLNNFFSNCSRTYRFPKNTFSSIIQTTGSVNKKIPVILLTEFAELLKFSHLDNIENNNIIYNVKNQIENIKYIFQYSYTSLPIFIFNYYYIKDENKYIITELWDINDSGYELLYLHHNFCSDILDVNFSNPQVHYDNTFETNESDFENCISSIPYLTIYAGTINLINREFREFVYRFPIIDKDNLFFDKILPVDDLDIFHYYWFVIPEFKGTSKYRYMDNIKNNTITINYVDGIHLLMLKVYESVQPSRS